MLLLCRRSTPKQQPTSTATRLGSLYRRQHRNGILPQRLNRCHAVVPTHIDKQLLLIHSVSTRLLLSLWPARTSFLRGGGHKNNNKNNNTQKTKHKQKGYTFLVRDSRGCLWPFLAAIGELGPGRPFKVPVLDVPGYERQVRVHIHAVAAEAIAHYNVHCLTGKTTSLN